MEIRRLNLEKQAAIKDLFSQFQVELQRQADLHKQTQQEQSAYADANTIMSLFGNSMTASFKVNEAVADHFSPTKFPSSYYSVIRGGPFASPPSTVIESITE